MNRLVDQLLRSLVWSGRTGVSLGRSRTVDAIRCVHGAVRVGERRSLPARDGASVVVTGIATIEDAIRNLVEMPWSMPAEHEVVVDVNRRAVNVVDPVRIPAGDREHIFDRFCAAG